MLRVLIHLKKGGISRGSPRLAKAGRGELLSSLVQLTQPIAFAQDGGGFLAEGADDFGVAV